MVLHNINKHINYDDFIINYKYNIITVSDHINLDVDWDVYDVNIDIEKNYTNTEYTEFNISYHIGFSSVTAYTTNFYPVPYFTQISISVNILS